MNRPLLLAVDCGSTEFKAAVFDEDLRRLGQAGVPVPCSRVGDRCVELPPEGVWEAFLEAAGAACRAAGVELQDLSRAAFASQAQTFALCDAAARPLTAFLSWMDRRAEEEAREAAAMFGEAFHRHCSFAPPIPQLQLCKMRWLSRRRPELCRAPATLAFLPGFLAWRLGVPNTVDRNLAAMGGAYSLAEGTWWRQALAFSGFAEVGLPALVDVGARVRACDAPRDGRFPAGLEVTFAGNDQTAGAVGNACHRGGLVVTLGTALVVYRHAGERPGPYARGGCWGPYPGGTFYELATQDQGCLALDWARARLLAAATPAAFDALAGRCWEAGRMADAPRFHPERVPDAAVPWKGPAGDPSATAYSVLEGIAFAVRRLLEHGLGAAPQRVRRIAVTGGGSRSALWLQILADALDTPVARGQGDALLGAAAMAVRREVPETGPGSAWTPDPQRVRTLAERYRCWLADP